jgi:acetylornithine deacetylase
LSSYPDRCVLQMERRTVADESGEDAAREVNGILESLAREDREFEAEARLTFARPAYEIPAGHPLPGSIGSALTSEGLPAETVGMSFWTDAAVLGSAGIPTVLFGPGGAGLHGREEYVIVADVIACRDVLAKLALTLSQRP